MKVTPVAPKSTVTMKTSDKQRGQMQAWWKLPMESVESGRAVLDSAVYLKESQGFRYRQAALYARLYGNQSLFSFLGTASTKVDQMQGLPTDRPTFNLIRSAADTLISRISQSRPAPVFLTDNGDYRERNLAKKLNNFILGEFYQTKTYATAEYILRDALVEGTGCVKVFEKDKKVAIERVLLTELMIDPNESVYGDPRQLYQIKLIDRQVLIESFPEHKKDLELVDKATVDGSAGATKTISDLVLVVEAWHLRSGPDAKDGRHSIVCQGCNLVDEEYTKDKFPFAFLHYSTRLLGFWAQGLAEQLMGTQIEINSLLFTISKAIKLVGVPRVFVEDGSKVVSAHNNNEVGVIVKYRGTKPSYEVAPCVPAEMYAQLQRLINYGYQDCGVSAMQASSEKPAGLNSGEAIRSYDDISADRYAALSRRYDNLFIDLAYLIVDLAKDIAERDGEYQTVYPGKNGTKTIDLPKASLLKDPFVIQCFNMSSLPRDPAGRMAKVTEMIQSGMITIKEGRRLLDYPDLEQVEQLANASEERIYQMLDEIVEKGKYTPPDPFLDLNLASEITVQYYNLYAAAKLEPKKCALIRQFYTQINSIKQAAQPPAPGAMPPGGAPAQAVPQAPPVSDILPNAPGAASAA